MKAVIAIDVHVLDSTPGLWCDVCYLPSITAHRVAIVNHETLKVAARMTATTCERCGATTRGPLP